MLFYFFMLYMLYFFLLIYFFQGKKQKVKRRWYHSAHIVHIHLYSQCLHIIYFPHFLFLFTSSLLKILGLYCMKLFILSLLSSKFYLTKKNIIFLYSKSTRCRLLLFYHRLFEVYFNAFYVKSKIYNKLHRQNLFLFLFIYNITFLR